MDLYSFHMCGSSKSDLIDCLKFLNLSIQSFKICNLKHSKIEGKHSPVLTFKDSPCPRKDYINYPFNPTSEVIAEHIYDYLSKLSDDDIEALGAAPTGDEEGCEIGWEIFYPDWYSDNYGLDEWDFQILAVKPALIEWGK